MSIRAQAAVRQNARELADAVHDLENWEREISTRDEKLKNVTTVKAAASLPPVRSQAIAQPEFTDARGFTTKAEGAADADAALLSTDDAAERPPAALRSEAVVRAQPASSEVQPDVAHSVREVLAASSESGKPPGSAARRAPAPQAGPSKALTPAEQRALVYKEEGNTLLNEGKLSESLAAYSKSLELDPLNAVVYANRAMAYLKLQRWDEAENDCDASITLNATYSKAYSRRAQARRAQNRFSEAIEDYQKVLQLEPGHKPTQIELQRTKEAMEQFQQPLRRRIKILQDDSASARPKDSEIKLEHKPQSVPVTVAQPTAAAAAHAAQAAQTAAKHAAQATTPLAPVPTAATAPAGAAAKPSAAPAPAATATPAAAATATVAPAAAPAAAPSTPQQASAAAGKPGAALATPSPVKIAATVPETPPKTAFEFERVWNSLKQDKQACWRYLQLVDPASYATLFKNNLEDAVVSAIFDLLNSETATKDASTLSFAFRVLDGLSHTQRFDMLVMFLSRKDKANLSAVFERVASDPLYAASVQGLKGRYKIA